MAIVACDFEKILKGVILYFKFYIDSLYNRNAVMIPLTYDFSNCGKISSYIRLFWWSDQYLMESKRSTVNAVSGSQQFELI